MKSVALKLVVLILMAQGVFMSAQERPKVRAPEITGGRGWLNTDKPLSIAALKGKVVLLDFWTYGCINCMHVLKDLKTLEQRFPDVQPVLGLYPGPRSRPRSRSRSVICRR